MVRAHVFIQGKVQGVFYRTWVKNTAHELGLTGFVKNLEDGKVEALFDGEKDKVENMIAKCKEGSRGAEVTHVDVIWEDSKGDYSDFVVHN